MIKKCAKALYLVGGLEQMFIYLTALEDQNRITAEQADDLMEAISTECANLTVGELNRIRNQF